jgi:hypothetical protein
MWGEQEAMRSSSAAQLRQRAVLSCRLSIKCKNALYLAASVPLEIMEHGLDH